ncbi:MAG: FAD-binding oxidoreductase [Gemmatimonadaceae bacterium]|jgi:sarcosine oxidase subunit beta|nr:FAD-binding oxidoreductase [Gemmatimonadaceae bacterium]
MTRRASTLVIGGGIIGASVAWHLAKRGLRDVVILDAASGPGAGSTGRATGGFRAQFSTSVNVRLSLLARAKLARFADEVGADPRARSVGYLFLAHDVAAMAAFRAARAVQHAEGLLEARELTVDEAAGVNPHVSLDGVVGAAWCPTDGTLRPLEILRGYLTDAIRLGVRVTWGERVRAFDRGADGRIISVHTDHETWAVDHVVNATGPWAARVAALAGFTLPVHAARRQIAVTAPLRTLTDDFPMTIWTRDAFHLRVRDGRALLNWPIDSDSDGDELSVDPSWVDSVWAKARARVPELASSRLDEGAHWAGFYEMSPDKTVILGATPGSPNLVLANGSSGHGVMHSPILGELVAEQILDGRIRTIDARPLRPERFAERDLNPVSDLL